MTRFEDTLRARVDHTKNREGALLSLSERDAVADAIERLRTLHGQTCDDRWWANDEETVEGCACGLSSLFARLDGTA